MLRADKILPPEATPETKEEHLKRLPALMCVCPDLFRPRLSSGFTDTCLFREFPLNSEICDPEENALLDVSSASPTIRAKGYAVGSKGALSLFPSFLPLFYLWWPPQLTPRRARHPHLLRPRRARPPPRPRPPVPLRTRDARARRVRGAPGAAAC